MNHSDTRISVIAEESEDTEDAQDLKRRFTALTEKYRLGETRFFFGAQESDEHKALERVIHDLDMVSMADVLILSAGHFSSLGAALQLNGTAFTLQRHVERGRYEGTSRDLPNHITGKRSGAGYVEWPILVSDSAELAPFHLE